MPESSSETVRQVDPRTTTTAGLAPGPLERAVLRLIQSLAPFYDPLELWPSLVRYAAAEPHRARFWWLRNVLASGALFPGILLYSLWRSRGRGSAELRVPLVIDCGDASYYERVFAGVAEAVGDAGVVRAGAGHGMDRPGPDSSLDRADALWLLCWGLALWPLLTLASIVTRMNWVQGFAKTFVVFFRARRYFTLYPCDVFLTYRDNMCSGAFYAGFHAAGGKSLCAVQNGVRWGANIYFSRFDHAFTLGRAWSDLYRNLGATGRITEIGSLQLGQNHMVITEGDPLDVLFIDQGPPEAGPRHWGLVGATASRVFLQHITRFAIENPDRRVAYQLRCYPGPVAWQETAIRKHLHGSGVQILDGCARFAAYAGVRRASVIATLHSTLALEALILGRVAIFFNLTGRREFDIAVPPLQRSDRDYQSFARVIVRALDEVWTPDLIDVDHLISRNTFSAPSLLGAALRAELRQETHGLPFGPRTVGKPIGVPPSAEEGA
jgi:hypothetical protein